MEAQQRHSHSDNGICKPEQVGVVVFVYDHVASYLGEIEVVPPYLYQAYEFERYDVEDKDVKRVFTYEYECVAYGVPFAVYNAGYVTRGKETYNAGRGEGEHIEHLAVVVHA